MAERNIGRVIDTLCNLRRLRPDCRDNADLIHGHQVVIYMIQSEPVLSNKTISTPKASAPYRVQNVRAQPKQHHKDEPIPNRDLDRTAIPFKSTCNHAIIRTESSSDSLASDAGLSFR